MLRRLLVRSLDAIGAVEGLLSRDKARWLPVLAYHRIRPTPDQFDHGVVDATPAALDWQVATLVRYFTPIGPSDLLEHALGNRPLPARPAMITFDDGYRECLGRALPVLQKHRAKATFFVVTGNIQERRVFWWDRIAYALHTSPRDRFRIDYPERRTIDLSSGAEPAVRSVLALVKASYDLDFTRFLDELFDKAEVVWGAAEEARWADEMLLDWAGVRELEDAGMEVGSHTHSHRILQNVPPAELRGELEGSRMALETELNAPVRTISYPVGRPISDSPQLLEAVRAAGYQLGFSTGTQWFPRRAHPLDLARTCLDADIEPAELRALLAHPAFGRA